MGTAILELKLAQEIASIDQDTLLLVFLDLQKAYDTVDCGHILTTLEVYGAGPFMSRLLAVFWGQSRDCHPPKQVSRSALQGNSGDH